MGKGGGGAWGRGVWGSGKGGGGEAGRGEVGKGEGLGLAVTDSKSSRTLRESKVELKRK